MNNVSEFHWIMHPCGRVNPHNAFVTDAVTICEIDFFLDVLALACILGKFWEFSSLGPIADISIMVSP